MFLLSFRLNKKIISLLCAVLFAAGAVISVILLTPARVSGEVTWINFNLTEGCLSQALKIDTESYNNEDSVRINWIELLAYNSAKYGDSTKSFNQKDLQKVLERLNSGERMEDICKDLKYYNYYLAAYTAVLGNMVGEYVLEAEKDGEVQKKVCYGLKSYCPIAEGYGFSHYDDFGASRSYGFNRDHTGHDIFSGAGTPVIACESGSVEELGWNRYGGWRVGIRSLDGKRYYYYAHLQKGHPYAAGIKKGDVVLAGDVIGYMGRTGYSTTEDSNGMNRTHLHFGLQIILDGESKDTYKQLWVDTYELTKFLSRHKSTVISPNGDGEFERAYTFYDPVVKQTSAELTQNKTKVPIIMYHSILKSSNGKNNYIVTPAQLEADLKFIAENGYTTVTLADLYNYVYGGTPLPQKCVMLTFDDGFYNNYHYAYPLLKSYGQKGVLSIVGSYTDEASRLGEDNPNYSYVTWEQAKELQDSGIVEIQSHSYNMHTTKGKNSIKRQSGEKCELFEQRFFADVTKMQECFKSNTDYTPIAFTYPFGIISPPAEKALHKAGFFASLTCCEGINTIIMGDAECLFGLKRNIRTPNISAADILKRY